MATNNNIAPACAGNNKARAAWHEAGHVVARWICGYEPTGAWVRRDDDGYWVGWTAGTNKPLPADGPFNGADLPFYASAGLTAEMLAMRWSYGSIGLAWQSALDGYAAAPSDDGDLHDLMLPCAVDSHKVVFGRSMPDETPVGLRVAVCSGGAVMLRDNWARVGQVKAALCRNDELAEADAARLFAEWGHYDPSTALRRMTRVIGPANIA